MFRISPDDSKTDLYGLNKGLAQVFDYSTTVNSNERRIASDERKKAAKLKASEGREDDLSKQLQGIGKLAIMDRDRPKFAELQSEVYALTKKNIDKIRSGDMNALMEVQQRIGDIYTRAELSKNTRERSEVIAGSIMQKGRDAYRPEDVERFNQFISGGPNGEHVEDYDTSQIMPKENINYNERVVKDLSSYAQKMAKDSPLTKVFTPKQAQELIADDLTNPIYFEQAAYDFNKATDKLGAKTPIEYYQKKYSPSLVVNDTKEAYYTGFSGNKDTRPKVNGTYTDAGNGKGEFQFEYTNTTDNPYLTIKDPKSGGAIEIKPIKVLFGGTTPVLQATTKSYKNADGEDVPAQTITLDYNSVSEIMHNKFGIKNIYDIKEGNEPSHVTVKRSDVSNSKNKTEKTVVKRGYNKSTNKTQLIYSDGSKEIIDGR